MSGYIMHGTSAWDRNERRAHPSALRRILAVIA